MRDPGESAFERHSRAAESGYPEHLTADARRRGAAEAVAALRRAGRAISPVVVRGRVLATSPQGRAWCASIDELAEVQGTRLASGRSYVRSGSVVDLQVEPGVIRALVQGTELYEVEVRVDAPVQPPLFPSPGAITATCTCPDDAPVCKHAAAALYAVGARLDHDPRALARLRGGGREVRAASPARPRRGSAKHAGRGA